MFTSPGKAVSAPSQWLKCPRCGSDYSPQGAYCPQCYASPATLSTTATVPLRRSPITFPLTREPQGSPCFTSNTRALLQFLPSGFCISLALNNPVLLGRGFLPGQDDLLDLTHQNAYQHGVSRIHCRLRRQDPHLLITDLGSTNGTHLNARLLLPDREYVVADGDELILGTLHVIVFFSTSGLE